MFTNWSHQPSFLIIHKSIIDTSVRKPINNIDHMETNMSAQSHIFSHYANQQSWCHTSINGSTCSKRQGQFPSHVVMVTDLWAGLQLTSDLSRNKPLHQRWVSSPFNPCEWSPTPCWLTANETTEVGLHWCYTMLPKYTHNSLFQCNSSAN